MSFLGDDPFAVPAELREPTRRLRGQLVAPVTVWTTSAELAGDVGVTVSSVLIAEGDEPAVLGLLGGLSDFWEALEESGRFVLHVLEERHRRISEIFAGKLPEPDPFGTVGATASAYGPRLAGISTLACCELVEASPLGPAMLVRAVLRAIELDAHPGAPLAYHRGRYLGVVEPQR